MTEFTHTYDKYYILNFDEKKTVQSGLNVKKLRSYAYGKKNM